MSSKYILNINFPVNLKSNKKRIKTNIKNSTLFRSNSKPDLEYRTKLSWYNRNKVYLSNYSNSLFFMIFIKSLIKLSISKRLLYFILSWSIIWL